MERPPRASGADARHAVPRSAATTLGEGQIGIAPPRECRATQRFQPCASQPRAVLRVARRRSRRASARWLPSSPRLWLRNGGRGPSPQPAPQANQRQPGSSTQSRVAATRCHGTRHSREHRLSSDTVPDQPPGLAPEVLVERMRMLNLSRDRLATRAQRVRSVGFPSARHALPLVGKRRSPLSPHRMQAPRWARPRDGRRQR